MRVGPLDPSQLAQAELVLADACAFDRATEVANEKLFGLAPVALPLGPALGGAPFARPTDATLTPRAFGAWENDALVGVAAVCGRWLRVLAVAPGFRHRGTGSALLAACEDAARAEGRLRILDQPGNYLAPGVDERNTEAIAWLERRGFSRQGEPRENVLIAVRDNPRVSAARASELAAKAATRGYEIRRARADEHALIDAVALAFGGTWYFELQRALPDVHVALKDDTYCAFAAHDGNNRGLGWFGPTGTLPEHRGQRLGEALLLACLVDVAAAHAYCEVAWIGPRPFYDKVAGISSSRRFISLAKSL